MSGIHADVPPPSIIWHLLIVLWKKVEQLMSDVDRLTGDISSLTTVEGAMETRLNAEVQARKDAAAAMQAEIDALKAQNPGIPAEAFAGLEAVRDRLASYDPDPAPAPAPAPATPVIESSPPADGSTAPTP